MKKLIEKNSSEMDESEPTDEQMYSALSFCIMLILVGIPLWWKTTEVYRVSLPYSEIDSLNEIQLKVQINITIATIENDHGTNLINQLRNLLRVSKLYNVNFIKKSIDKELIGSCKTLEDIEKKIKHPSCGSFQLLEIPGLIRFTPKNIILGLNRTAYFSSDTDIIKLQNFLNKKILKEEFIANIILSKNSSTENTPNELSTYTTISPSSEFDILFTVLIPEPNFIDIVFDIPEALEEYITPVVKSLEAVNKFNLKSQWLYFVNLEVHQKFLNYTAKGPHFALPENFLPHLITPLEKKIASHTSKYPCLNFILYVPSCNNSPLYIYTKKGFPMEEANAFISPDWGGIQIYNPNRKFCYNKTKAVVHPEKYQIMSVFVQQLRLLLGIPQLTMFEDVDVINTPAYIRLWEVDFLVRIKIFKQLWSAKLTLQSLSKLLGKISNIVINDAVGEAIYNSLDNIYKATNALNNGKIFDAYNHSKKAFLSSETAFTDSSLLALLYFPDDQKYAVYIPLFLPVMIPVFISLKYIKHWGAKKLKKKQLKTKKG